MKGSVHIQHPGVSSLLKDRPSVFRRDRPFQDEPLSYGTHAAGRWACSAGKSNLGAFSSGVPGMIFSV